MKTEHSKYEVVTINITKFDYSRSKDRPLGKASGNIKDYLVVVLTHEGQENI